MTPRYPGARWYGGTGNGDPCSHEGCSWHQAVTTAGVDNLIGWGQQAKSFHMVVARYGDCGQGADFDEAVNGTKDGNGRMLTVETWDDLLVSTERSPDGSHGANDFPWDDGQRERIVDIGAFLNIELGIPIRRMMNTRERGHAPHRLGVPSPSGSVDVGYGPDRWTKWPGKACCGDERIRQLFGDDLQCGPGSIIFDMQRLADAIRAGRATYLPTGNVDVAAARARYNGGRSAAQWVELFAAAVRG